MPRAVLSSALCFLPYLTESAGYVILGLLVRRVREDRSRMSRGNSRVITSRVRGGQRDGRPTKERLVRADEQASTNPNESHSE